MRTLQQIHSPSHGCPLAFFLPASPLLFSSSPPPSIPLGDSAVEEPTPAPPLPSMGPVFSGNQTACSIFSGSWVSDDSYPLYRYSSCPAIDATFNCQRFGRPDSGYQRYRWRPTNCELLRRGFPSSSSSSVSCLVAVGSWDAYKNGVFVCRFDALYFLSSLRGKTILFVGDSLSRDQWESLLCLLTPSLSPSETQFVRGDVFSTFKALVSF